MPDLKSRDLATKLDFATCKLHDFGHPSAILKNDQVSRQGQLGGYSRGRVAARAKAQDIKCRGNTGSCKLLGFTEVKSRDWCGEGYGHGDTQDPAPKALTLW